MSLTTIFSKKRMFKDKFACYWLLAVAIWFGTQIVGDAAVITAQSASRADVGAAVALADDGDTVLVPAGSATWTSTLTVTKNILLIGAGEDQTIITENLTRTDDPPLISVSLSHDSPSQFPYSFRLSGFKFTSANPTGTALTGDDAFIEVTGLSHATDSVRPYVRGCVSRVRLDHLTLQSLNGIFIRMESVLGVGDHITTIESGTTYDANTMVVWHTNWTPAVDPATGNPIPSNYSATKAYGSWADDPYWGTDKYWFFEDCNFTMPDNTNVSDDQQGARVVYRHCTFNGGGGVATHGMEGRQQMGVKQHEIYNNLFLSAADRSFAQHRSGSVLYFNNKSDKLNSGVMFKNYRETRTDTNWGMASGDNRYDKNLGGSPLYTGTVTATNGTTSITDSNQANFNSINLTDGTLYGIVDKDVSAGTRTDPGWLYKGNTVKDKSGNTLTLSYESGFSPTWVVGHKYEIRKMTAAFGQTGQGKGNLLNGGTNGLGAYETYPYPATSGPKATYPQEGYPLEPCYSWNNTDNTHGYLAFSRTTTSTTELSVLEGRDYFNLSERTIETQNVGYPPVSYTRATSSYPNIGPNQMVPYTPYTYPHPLTQDQGSEAPSPPEDLRIIP